MNLRTILFSQYPALFLLAVLFLIAHLRVRKTSAVKSVLWVILFGAALAASVVCCFLGIQAELWTLKTLITLGFWSWFGVGLVLLFLVLRVVHGMEKRSSRRRLDKAMKQAEKQKEEEVARARAEGAAAERERAETEAAARAEEAAREEAARAAAEAAAAQDAPSGETTPAEANEAAEAATEEYPWNSPDRSASPAMTCCASRRPLPSLHSTFPRSIGRTPIFIQPRGRPLTYMTASSAGPFPSS